MESSELPWIYHSSHDNRNAYAYQHPAEVISLSRKKMNDNSLYLQLLFLWNTFIIFCPILQSSLGIIEYNP